MWKAGGSCRPWRAAGNSSRRNAPNLIKNEAKPLILGIGNVLLGDEGIGSLAARKLEESDLAAKALIVDGGTGGFQLLSFFSEHSRIIMIDAAADGRPPGTVSVLRPKFANDFPKSLSAHDIGLKDLVEAASLLGALPDISLITVSVEKIQPMTLDLSPPVEAALPEIERIVRTLLFFDISQKMN